MTEPWYGHTMDPDEIDTFLRNQAVGVLCLANDRRAYGVPISFAYDHTEGRCVMDLGFTSDSKKRTFIPTTDECCLTVFEWNDTHDWRSVMAIGRLDRVPENDIDPELESWYHRIATDIDVGSGIETLEWYVLDIDDLSGVALYP